MAFYDMVTPVVLSFNEDEFMRKFKEYIPDSEKFVSTTTNACSDVFK